MEKRNLQCLSCRHHMQEVRIDSHYGQDDILIEQCPKCGDLWFDNFELQRSKRGESKSIDTAFDESIYQNSEHSRHQNLHCPIDNTQLTPLQGLTIAQHLSIETCPQCHGVLLNPGEFLAFQGETKEALKKDLEHRQEYMTIALDPDVTEEMDTSLGVGFGKALAKEEYRKMELEEKREQARRRNLRAISPERYYIELLLDFIIKQFNTR